MSYSSLANSDFFGESPSDLDWLAFCYLTDELSPAERSAFEQGLADDQDYREALARAVELHCAVASAYDGVDLAIASDPVKQAPVARPVERWIQAATWLTIASAASLAFVVAYWALNPQVTDLARQSEPKVSTQTALLWSQMQESSPAAEMELLSELAPLPGDVYALDEVDEYTSDTSTDVPSWLLTAVSSRAASDSDLPDADQQNQPDSNLPEDL